MEVKGPVAALAELAVADDVDTGLDLLAHDLVDRLLEARLVGGLVIGLAGLDELEEIDQPGRPDQAADVGCQDAIFGACHCVSSDAEFAESLLCPGLVSPNPPATSHLAKPWRRAR